MATQTESPIPKSLRFIFDTWKALIARMLFIVHGSITFWRVSDVNKDPFCYFLWIPMALLLVEFAVTTTCTTTGEWKWFCPVIFLYILSVVPGLWLLQLDLYFSTLKHKEDLGLDMCGSYTTNVTGFPEIHGVHIPLELSSTEWALALQQMLLVLIIVGRWLLPKGELTRDQLSQLLMVYVGVAADSLEFSLETLKLQAVICDLILILIILSIWSWSLLQFCFNTTITTSDEPRKSRLSVNRCFKSEIWSLMVSIGLQDAPYLVMRLFLMIYAKTVDQMMLFFTFKNVIVILLQLYRFGILFKSKKEETKPLNNECERSPESNEESNENAVQVTD